MTLFIVVSTVVFLIAIFDFIVTLRIFGRPLKKDDHWKLDNFLKGTNKYRSPSFNYVSDLETLRMVYNDVHFLMPYSFKDGDGRRYTIWRWDVSCRRLKFLFDHLPTFDIVSRKQERGY